MTLAETATLNCSWLGLMQLVKPAKGQMVGFAYADWHHFAIIDDYVLLYIWDSREIIDAFPLKAMDNFETVKITDNGKQLFIGQNTSERAKAIVAQLCDKYDLPIIVKGGVPSLTDLKDAVSSALQSVNHDVFNCVDNTMSAVFVPKTMQLPETLYMYKLAPTLNPSMYKLVDPTSYLGRSKHYAIIAHAYVLNLIESLNK